MTKEQVKQLQDLHALFLKECERVVNILEDYDVFTQDWGGNIHFADTFRITEEGDVRWDGDEHWAYQGHEHHDGNFPMEYLTMTEEELRAEANRLNEEFLAERRKEEEEKEKREKERKYKDYLKLKEEFE